MMSERESFLRKARFFLGIGGMMFIVSSASFLYTMSNELVTKSDIVALMLPTGFLLVVWQLGENSIFAPVVMTVGRVIEIAFRLKK